MTECVCVMYWQCVNIFYVTNIYNTYSGHGSIVSPVSVLLYCSNSLNVLAILICNCEAHVICLELNDRSHACIISIVCFTVPLSDC